MKTGLLRHLATKFWPSRTCLRSTSTTPAAQTSLPGHRLCTILQTITNEGGGDEARGGTDEVDPRAAVRVAGGEAVGAEVQGALRHRGDGLRGVLSPADRAEALRAELGDGGNRGLLRVMPDVRA